MRLLVTRPQPQGEETAAALRALGHAVLLAPLLRIAPIAEADLGPGPWAAIAMTSANAARAIASHKRRAELIHLPVFVVGRRTGEAARAAGFLRVDSADRDVTELSGLLAERLPERGRILYLAGADRAGDLAGTLGAAGFAVHTAIVYRAMAEMALPAEVSGALAAGEIDGILHFSRRSAAAFLAAAGAARLFDKSLRIQHFCLSRQVAEPLVSAGAAAIRVAARPSESALLELIGRG